MQRHNLRGRGGQDKVESVFIQEMSLLSVPFEELTLLILNRASFDFEKLSYPRTLIVKMTQHGLWHQYF